MPLVPEIDYGTPASRSEKMVTLTIDGRDITVPEGTSIMRASMEAGIQVPKLCATDMLDAFGSCRLCLVEIEGRNGTPASCTTPVAPGIKVKTQTERLEGHPQGRDGTLHLRPSARLSHLCCQRRLRAAGHGGCRRPARCALWLRGREPRQGPVAEGGSTPSWMPKDESEPLFHL
jgi:formate dehydrogenase major subunit